RDNFIINKYNLYCELIEESENTSQGWIWNSTYKHNNTMYIIRAIPLACKEITEKKTIKNDYTQSKPTIKWVQELEQKLLEPNFGLKTSLNFNPQSSHKVWPICNFECRKNNTDCNFCRNVFL